MQERGKRKGDFAALPKIGSLVKVLRRRAEEHPLKVAFTFLERGHERSSITYAELDERARALAARLQKKLQPGDRALLLYKPGLDYIVGFYGCLYAGVVAVPAYPPDPSRLNRMVPRLLKVIEDCDPRVILTTSEISFQLKLLGLRSRHFLLRRWLSSDTVPAAEAASYREPDHGPDTLAYLQYTSGSTGDPKGVMVTHRNILHNSESISRWLGDEIQDNVLSWLPLYHDMGLIGFVIHGVYRGFRTYFMSPFDFLKDPYCWLETVSRLGITATGGPNFAYHLCTTRIKDEQLRNLDLGRWKLAFCGAEPVRADTLAAFARRFGPCGFSDSSFAASYGLAEATLFVAATPVRSGLRITQIDSEHLMAGVVKPAENPEHQLPYVSCGLTSMPDTTVKIIDAPTKTPLGPNRVGEIWVSSPSVAAGYWRRPELNESHFADKTPGDRRGLLRTGDLGFLDDNGQLFITGRVKDLIIINGQNHYPSDIEDTATRAATELRAGCLAAFSVANGDSERLVLVAECKKSLCAAALSGLEAKVKKAIFQRHELTLAELVLIPAGRISKTTSGKIQRHASKREYLAGKLPRVEIAPEKKPPSIFRRLFASDANESDSTLADVLAVLRGELKSAAELGPATEFGAMGISSLQAVQLAGELSARFGTELSPALFWNLRSPSELASHIAGLRGGSEGKNTKKSPSVPAEVASPARSTSIDDVAIVACGARFPGAAGPESFWSLLEGGRHAISELRGVPSGYVEGVERFDSLFFGISPREAERMDPQQRILLEVCWEALERAGIRASGLAEKNVGLFVGASTVDYVKVLRESGLPNDLQAATGNSHAVIANRLSFLLNLRGPSLSIDTACSSSLVAVHEAVKSVRSGESSLAIAGGVNLLLDPSITETFAEAGMLSPDGRCFTFDENGNGYVRGEGCGVVVLMPLASAVAQGHEVLAVVRGSRIEHGGRTNSLTAPSARSQGELIERTYLECGVHPDSVGYVEAHGTATKLGDPIEWMGLQQAFAALAEKMGSSGIAEPGNCFVGSVKTNIGHLEAGAGIAGLIKILLMLQHRKIPESLHFRRGNPAIDFNRGRLRVARELGEWPAVENGNGALPRRAGISSFGFGGMNAHLVLEEASGARPQRGSPGERELILLSAKSESALARYVAAFHEFLPRTSAELSRIAYTSQLGRDHFRYRLAVAGSSKTEIAERLGKFLEAKRAGSGIWVGEAASAGEMTHASLDQSAAGWVKGADVDWAKFHSQRPTFTVIPTYPFEPAKHWPAMAKSVNAAPASAATEPAAALVYPKILRASDFFLRDHKVGDRQILPGVCHLEFVREAARALLGADPCGFEEVVWQRPVVVREQEHAVEIRLTEEGGGSYHFELGRAGSGDRKPYSKGRLRLAAGGERAAPVESFLPPSRRAAFGECVGVYEKFAEFGLNYGETFRAIRQIQGNDHEAWADIELGPEHADLTDAFGLHPSLLDAALGVSIGIGGLSRGAEAGVYIPFLLERVELFGPVRESCVAHGRLRAGSSEAGDKRFDVTVFARDGVVLAKFYGITVKRVPQAASARAPALVLCQDQLRDVSRDPESTGVFHAIAEVGGEASWFKDAGAVPRVPVRAAAPAATADEVARFLSSRGAGLSLVVVDLAEFSGWDSWEFLHRVSTTAIAHVSEKHRVCFALVHRDSPGLDDAFAGAIRGFAAALAGQSPFATFRVISCDGESLTLLSRELFHYSNPLSRLEKGARWIPGLAECGRRRTRWIPLRKGGVYLLSGGAGGIGRELSRFLRERYGATVAVLGRRPAAEASVASGEDYFACDVAKKDEVTETVAEVLRRHGRIDGVFHLAGTLELRKCGEKSWDEFRANAGAKVTGCLNLDEATAGCELDFFFVSSSISAVLGDGRMADYACGNAFLDSFVEYRKRLVRRGLRRGWNLGVRWPHWDTLGMQMPASFRELSEARFGFRPMPASVGLESLLEVFGDPAEPSLTVFYGDTGTIRDALLKAPSLAKEKAEPVAASAADVGAVEAKLVQVFAGILQLKPADVRAEAAWTDYGLDSLGLIELKGKVESAFQAKLDPAKLFECGNIRNLAALIAVSVPVKVQEDSSPAVENAARTPSAAPEKNEYPLTKSQEAMWFLYQLAPESYAYHIPVGVRLAFAADRVRVRRAFEALANEQPALRAVFSAGAPPRQTVLANPGVEFSFLDLNGAPPETVDAAVSENVRLPFSLGDTPGFRVLLVRRAPEDFLVVATAHHIVFDGLSLALLMRRFAELYTGTGEARAADFSFFRFAERQGEYLAGAAAERDLEFWRSRLLPEAPPLALPCDLPRPALQTFEGTTTSFRVEGETLTALRHLAKSEKVTLNSVLLGAFYVFLRGYTSQDDLVVGVPTLGRSGEEMNALGYFVNMLPLRERVEPRAPVRDFLARLHRDVSEALGHGEYPFPLVVDRLRLVRDPARSPGFQACFVFQNMLKELLQAPAEGFSYSHVRQQEGQFELELELVDLGTELSGNLKFNRDLFTLATAKGFAESYRCVLENLPKFLGEPLGKVPVLPEAEKTRIVRGFNDTAFDFGAPCGLHELFERQAAATPSREAVRFGCNSLTYGELNARANQLARRLRREGVKSGQQVGVLMERSLEMEIALFGVLKCGAAYLPIDPALPEKRVRYMVRDSGVALVLTQEKFHALAERLGARALVPSVRDDGTDGSNLGVRVTGASPAYNIYTSGSTGEPKGAVNSHAGICNRLLWMQKEYGLTGADRVLQKTPFTFDVSVWEFFWPLITGAALVVLEPEAHRDPALLCRRILEEKITVLHFVPSMLAVFLEEARLEETCGSLRLVFCSGEALPAALTHRFFERLSAGLHNLYGPTEASVDVTYWHCRPEAKDSTVLIGRPIANTQLHILDDFDQPVPVGVTGELFIGGVGLALGYHNRPELTRERFRASPFGTGRLYRTGDLARYHRDGTIEYLGRIDGQVKLRGFRIELGEIEARLLEVPELREAVVVARETPVGKELVAYFTVRAGDSPGEEALRARLAEQLPEYMIPARFVLLERIPLSHNGKVDRKRLPDPVGGSRPQAKIVAPRNEVEAKVHRIWANALGGDGDFGVFQSFFEAGGNSLLSVRLLRDLSEAFGVELRIRDFYAEPTIAAIARRVANPGEGTAVPDISDTLRADAELGILSFHGPAARRPGGIFLTGATGFLGAYLLSSILKSTEDRVYCLVRAGNEGAAFARVEENLRKYGLWKAAHAPRVHAVPGDLAEPRFGLPEGLWQELAGTIAVVYHNAAKVNFVQPYELLKRENVDGTREVLRFCGSGFLKPLHFISTVSVFDSVTYSAADELVERRGPVAEGLYSGYAQSKWVAERLVFAARERGLPAWVYRPGAVTGDTITGRANPDDLTSRLLAAVVQMLSVPELPLRVDMVPVDFVADAIVALSNAPSATPAYHLVNPAPLPVQELKELFVKLGHAVESKNFEAWVRAITADADNPLAPLLPVFTEKEPRTGLTQAELSSARPRIDGAVTAAELRSLGLHCPKIDEKLLERYLAALPPELRKKRPA
jgi:iturin family lipopeptide synthetase A